MREHAGDECPRLRGEPVRPRSVVEAIACAVPEREVHMAAVARVLGPRLRCERGDETPPACDPADRLADEDLLICRLQRRCVPGGDLLLTVPKLGVVLLERDRLRGQSGGELVCVVLRLRRCNRREAECRVDRNVRVAGPRRERELVLERGAQC